ncbi:MAG: hypothetical protein HXY28_08855 [Hydrogenophilaceae bacterium]|jgi:hypothetical protein|nr:hypothetical protein [Hydrogenophilaceae bacterium]
MKSIAALMLAAALAACATAEPREDPFAADQEAPQASIAFADFGSIRSFRPLGDDAVLLEGAHGRWYRATFFGSCPDLPFTESVAMDSDAAGRVDRFSAIIVRGRRCAFRTLVEVPDPDAAAEEAAPAEAEEPR